MKKKENKICKINNIKKHNCPNSESVVVPETDNIIFIIIKIISNEELNSS